MIRELLELAVKCAQQRTARSRRKLGSGHDERIIRSLLPPPKRDSGERCGRPEVDARQVDRASSRSSSRRKSSAGWSIRRSCYARAAEIFPSAVGESESTAGSCRLQAAATQAARWLAEARWLVQDR